MSKKSYSVQERKTILNKIKKEYNSAEDVTNQIKEKI